MCGIAGIVNLSGAINDLSLHIKNMTDAIRHRGPDGEGFLFYDGENITPAFCNDTPEQVLGSSFNYSPKTNIRNYSGNYLFALGHRRLSIIDVTAAGHQPMSNKEGNIWLVFNGEIYNYIELREDLKQKGFSFLTNTDTEVVLTAYSHWGEDCVKHFNGMWAFVIFDKRKNSLFCSRDRFGVKPFYFYRDSHVFAFASEQKALVKLPFVKTGINFNAASAFLAGDIHSIERGEENMFKNIFELMPSHNLWMDLNKKSFQKTCYYELKFNNEYSDYHLNSFEKYKSEVESLFVDAVKLRLRSDVPVGSCLSGGIDSSAIVSVIGKLASEGHSVNLGGKLKVFTLKFDDQSIDETRWAKYVVDQTKAEWHLVSPDADGLLKNLETLNYCQDVPICSTGTYGQFQLMKEAKQSGIKVVLDGQGGDELFGGYYSHSKVFWKELLRNGKYAKAVLEVSSDGKTFVNLKEYLKDSLKSRFSSFSLMKAAYNAVIPQNSFLQENVVDEYFQSGIFFAEKELSRSSSLNEALKRDFINTRLKMYLKYEDRSSMWHSIEARTPLADDDKMIDYVFQIPSVYKIYKGINKYIFREAAAKFLPREIRERKDKLGLVTPIDKWTKQIGNHCLHYFDDSISDLIDVKKIKNNPKKFFNINNHADGTRIFRMISFAVWKKVFQM